jgi:hypothetical protein
MWLQNHLKVPAHNMALESDIYVHSYELNLCSNGIHDGLHFLLRRQ